MLFVEAIAGQPDRYLVGGYLQEEIGVSVKTGRGSIRQNPLPLGMQQVGGSGQHSIPDVSIRF